MTNPRLFKLENSLFSETVLPPNDFTGETYSLSLLESQNLISRSEYSCTDVQTSQNICDETEMSGQLSASETLERYLSAHAPETYHRSEHSCSQIKHSSQICGGSIVQSANLTNHSAGNVTSFTARDIAQTSTPRNQSGYEYHQSTRGAENSEHGMSSSTSSVLSTLDKLRDKLSQPARQEFNPSQENFVIQYSPVGFILPQASHPMISNELKNVHLQTQMCNSVSNEYNQAKEVVPVNSANMMGGYSVKVSAQNEVAQQTDNFQNEKGSEISRGKVGYSPMDLVKLAEAPVSSSGLSLRPKSSLISSQRMARKPNPAKTKTINPNNLRRSKSLVSRKTEISPDQTVVPPKNVTWEHGSPEPQYDQNLLIVTSNRQETHCGCSSSYQNPMKLPSETKCPTNCANSVVSFQCSTCVPKPLKPRSKTNTPRSALPVSTIQPEDVIAKTNPEIDHYRGGSLAAHESIKLPTSTNVYASRFANASNPVLVTPKPEEEKASHRSLPPNAPSLRPPIPTTSKPTQDFKQISSSTERPWHEQIPDSRTFSNFPSRDASVSVKTSHVLPANKPILPTEQRSPALPSTSVNKLCLKPTLPEQLNVASNSHIPQTLTTNFNSNSKESIAVNKIVADCNLPSQRVPTTFTKPSEAIISLPEPVPPINVCNNESYVSAFDHLPLRCSTPRSLIPSHRPVGEVTTDGAEPTSDRPGNVNHTHSAAPGGSFTHGTFGRQQTPFQQVNSRQPGTTYQTIPDLPVNQVNSDASRSTCQVNSKWTGNVNRVSWNQPGTAVQSVPSQTGPVYLVSSGSSHSQVKHQPFSPPIIEEPHKKPALSELESFRILAESAIDNESELFDTVIEKSSPTSSKKEVLRNIPPLSLVGSNGEQPIDSLKNLVRDMTAVTSATRRLADASLNSTQETQSPNTGGSGPFEDVLTENSIMTKSTLEALALVERGPEQFSQQVNSHLNSIRTLNSYAAPSST